MEFLLTVHIVAQFLFCDRMVLNMSHSMALIVIASTYISPYSFRVVVPTFDSW